MEDPAFYNISTDTFLEAYTRRGREHILDKELDEAATDMVKLVRDGTIWFPFHRFFMGDPDTLFENLKHIDLPILNKPYRLYSYYPLYGSYLPPLFRGEPTVISSIPGTYVDADVLSDHFIEDIRLKSMRYDQEISILQCWESNSCLKDIMKAALKEQYIDPASLRDVIYKTIPETKIFNPTWAKALLKLVLGTNLKGKKWLDISAGWGDRIITAMALGMEYVGFDPNIELKPGHTAMIERFGNPAIHRIIYEAFEKANIPKGPYKFILSSTPYFNLEKYAIGQQGQSIENYPDFDKWMVWFLFASLEKAWENLEEGGYLILHLGDARTIVTAEATNIFIENYLPGASWEGVIGLQGQAGYPRPVWVWKRVPRNAKRTIWEPKADKRVIPGQKAPLPYSRRTLYHTYPALQSGVIRYYANRYAPYYTIRRSNSEAFKADITSQLNKTYEPTINELFKDDLLISSILETTPYVDTILLLKDIIESTDPISDKINKAGKLATDVNPYYLTRKTNSDNIRDHVAARLPNASIDLINDILHDDLMLSSLIETLGSDGTITWSVAMIKLALHV